MSEKNPTAGLADSKSLCVICLTLVFFVLSSFLKLGLLGLTILYVYQSERMGPSPSHTRKSLIQRALGPSSDPEPVSVVVRAGVGGGRKEDVML